MNEYFSVLYLESLKKYRMVVLPEINKKTSALTESIYLKKYIFVIA